MPYTHGQRWNEQRICDELMNVVRIRGIDTMPTHSEIAETMGNECLVSALVKHGGTKYFAKLLNLSIKQCESEKGDLFEERCAAQITDMFGLDVKKMKPRYPYDLLVDGSVKVDVKAGSLYTTKINTKFYTFNLEKCNPTCDIYVCYCLDDGGEPCKTLVVPSSAVSGKCQLSVGFKSGYDKYIDNWELIESYAKFFRN